MSFGSTVYGFGTLMVIVFQQYSILSQAHVPGIQGLGQFDEL
jgi:hypothetical protein